MDINDQGQGQSEPSIRERIGNLLSPSQEQAPEPVEEVTQEEVPETETQQVTETPEEVEETNLTADWKEVELDGERIQVPPKFEKAFLQERDYTQKTQQLADHRRLVEQREKGLYAQQQALTQLAPLYAQGQALQETIQRYERLDWDSLRASDPLAYSNHRADYATLLQQRNDLGRHIEQGHFVLAQHQQRATMEAVKAAEPIIRKSIPDWGPEKANKLTQFALDHGASVEELRGLDARPWAVVLLDMAMKQMDLQASKAQLPKKAQHLSPVAKPGAKPSGSSDAASYRKNQETFRKSGGKDPGALRALIKARIS